MFKKFLQLIIDAKNAEELDNIFYGSEFDEAGNITKYGIDLAYQHNKINFKELEILTALINKIKGY